MNEQIYIVIRQDCFDYRGRRFALISDNVVVGAWLSKSMVDYFFERRIPDFIELGYTCEHLTEANSTGLVDRYIIKDRNGEVDTTYSVILEPVI